MKTQMLLVLATLAAACGGAAIPADKLAQSQAAVRSAEEVGAANDPTAALHLKLAREQLDEARKQIRDNENERAEYLLVRAKADAELAMNLAREQKAKQDAAVMMQNVQKARSSMQQQPSTQGGY